MSEMKLSKSVNDQCQQMLKELLNEEHNKYCADCGTKGPQWASWNIGVFICIKCAGIHRNLGVHISKVKSTTLDTWNHDHLFMLKKLGNKKANEVYEANLPKTFCRYSDLDSLIRCKYEYKNFMLKDWIPPTQEKKSHKKHLKSSRVKKYTNAPKTSAGVEETDGRDNTNHIDELKSKDIPVISSVNNGNSSNVSCLLTGKQNNDSPISSCTDVITCQELCNTENLIPGFNDITVKSKKGHTLCSSLWE